MQPLAEPIQLSNEPTKQGRPRFRALKNLGLALSLAVVAMSFVPEAHAAHGIEREPDSVEEEIPFIPEATKAIPCAPPVPQRTAQNTR